ncbi:hypothetical protein [Shimia sp. MMG029]|uniref:hypothetical protein n=1 Tax=Shimia sp. MMG029 TaxID=3021978 RepID=UPI0022FF3A86|nr:hypothetical protein [Shimia sp. MMG029]MDA5555878.1 hypothetical protein [Shimia sp. MMG029]
MKTMSAIAVVLFAIPLTANAATWERIKTETQLLEVVAGKQFSTKNGWWEIRSDGSMVGILKGDELRGAWKWDKGAWCRNYVFKGKEKKTNCQHVWSSGNQVRFKKDRGQGDEDIQTLVAK